MTQFALLSDDGVCRMLIKANDMQDAIRLYKKFYNYKVSYKITAIKYSDYKKTQR